MAFRFSLKQLTARNRKQVPFKIVESRKGEPLETSLRDIQSGNTDVLFVRNFITPENCDLLVENLKKENQQFDSDKHPIYPSSFAQIDRHSENFESEMQSYFVKSAEYVENFGSRFEFDLLAELSTLFSELNPDGEEKAPLGFDGVGRYIPGTFRIQHPEKVNINLHCGNQFIELFPKYYEHLSRTVNVIDQLSYFVVLQEADEGGELIIYDVLWDEAKVCDTVENSITYLNGETVHLDKSKKIASEYLKLGKGDLIIFSGGQIWHAVNQVKGNKYRITFGGFLAFGKSASEQSNFYTWS